MRKLIVLIIVGLFLFGCAKTEDIKQHGFNYIIIDTVYVSSNGFHDVIDCTVILQIDSTYYSAKLNTNGNVTELYRKLNGLNNQQ